jgi:hypothetical protein
MVGNIQSIKINGHITVQGLTQKIIIEIKNIILLVFMINKNMVVFRGKLAYKIFLLTMPGIGVEKGGIGVPFSQLGDAGAAASNRALHRGQGK